MNAGVQAVELPIKFPNDVEVIAEDAARFRALTAEERVHELGECFETFQFLADASGRRAEIERLAREDEERGRAAIVDFVPRHG